MNTQVSTQVRTAGVVARGVRRVFDGRTVLDGLDLEIAPGEFVALLGPSGCGRSTLLKAIGGLDSGAEGEFSVPASRSIVFQEHRLLPWERVWRNVALGIGGSMRERRERAVGRCQVK